MFLCQGLFITRYLQHNKNTTGHKEKKSKCWILFYLVLVSIFTNIFNAPQVEHINTNGDSSHWNKQTSSDVSFFLQSGGVGKAYALLLKEFFFVVVVFPFSSAVLRRAGTVCVFGFSTGPGGTATRASSALRMRHLSFGFLRWLLNSN